MRKVVASASVDEYLVVVCDDGAVFRQERKGWVELAAVPLTLRHAKQEQDHNQDREAA
jgi:hypothetical protein